MIQLFLPVKFLMKRNSLSERTLAEKAGVSRGAVRGILSGKNLTLSSVERVASAFERRVELVAAAPSIMSQYSTVASALFVERDGFESWKIHFMNLVDEFRRTADARLLLLPPHTNFDPKLFALLASIVRDLTEELEMATPEWSRKRRALPIPWFVSEMQSLKASALLESPLPYRANNIFVTENFLSRA